MSQYETLENIKKNQSSYKNKTFKIPAPTRNEEFEFPDGSYFVSGTIDYLEYLKRTWRKD